MQLVAYGAQDIYLTGNPQITFFKVVYRRHTNFSMEAIEQTWNGSHLTSGRCTATISRNGDLVHKMYIELVNAGGSDVDNPGSFFVENVELEIGGQRIDRHSGDWMETWAELTQPNPSGTVGAGTGTFGATGTLFQATTGMGGICGAANNANYQIFVPLQFWFCRNPGLALPLIALQYHEVKVILDHRGTDMGAAAITTNKLWCDYIYLDTDERRRFAQVSHEYLIEQVQQQTWSATSTDLNFNHPVKELIWSEGKGADTPDTTRDAISGANWKLKLNGHDRFAARDYRYFTRVQVLQHHTGGSLTVAAAGASGKHGDSIGVYSFALKPEEHQPSGTCNFSRIDNAQLEGTNLAGGGTLNVYAVNYNVLRIMSGMGGLAYSN